MKRLIVFLFPIMIVTSCGSGDSKPKTLKTDSLMTKTFQVKLITVDPGHFHAALVQKYMYDQVSPDVHVYAPQGPDYIQHINRIRQYNSRPIKAADTDLIISYLNSRRMNMTA